MKSFVRRIGRVSLIIGITGLSIFTVVATVLLSPPPAHAQSYQGNCSDGWYRDSSGVCRPNGYCPTGTAMEPDGSCIPDESNPNKCNPGYTWQNPDDASQCLPMSQPCGSASQFNNSLNACVLIYDSVQTYIKNHFGR
jgi:hypothetical protein